MNAKKLEELKKDPTRVDQADHVRELLGTIPKEDVNRPGLKETPYRVAKMYGEIFSGYLQDAEEILTDATFTDIPSDDIVLVSDIQFYSMCEHHIMPFFGKVHIAYIPSEGNVVGISKLARIVEVYARRLQVQERLGQQLANVIQKVLKPQAVAVLISAEHTCMTARGIQKPGTLTSTACLRGLFRENGSTKKELYDLMMLRK